MEEVEPCLLFLMFARPSASATATPNIMLRKPLVSLSEPDVYVPEVPHRPPPPLVLCVDEHVACEEPVPMRWDHP